MTGFWSEASAPWPRPLSLATCRSSQSLNSLVISWWPPGSAISSVGSPSPTLLLSYICWLSMVHEGRVTSQDSTPNEPSQDSTPNEQSEPSQDGKSLAIWLQRLVDPSVTTRQNAVIALNRIT